MGRSAHNGISRRRKRGAHHHFVARHAFTLVELLVVIAILALLISVLVPALRKARLAAQEAVCISNLRQLGYGFELYAQMNKDQLPIDGPDGSSNSKPSGLIGKLNANDHTNVVVSGPDDPVLWYNAIPAVIHKKSYYELFLDDFNGVKKLPTTGDNSIFICPTADAPGTNYNKDGALAEITAPSPAIPGDKSGAQGIDGYFHLWMGRDTDIGLAGAKRYFKCNFSYVFNSQLFNKDYKAWKLTQLRPMSSCILLVEKLSTPAEYKWPEEGATMTGSTYQKNVGQLKATWSRFTTRHRGGGYLLFADAHVAWFKWTDVLPPVNPLTQQLGDINQPNKGLIWNPLEAIIPSPGGSD